MRARGCVRAHTHRLHVWQVMRYMEHFSTRIFIFSNTDFYLFEHEFYFFRTRILFFEHELHELNESDCLRNIHAQAYI